MISTPRKVTLAFIWIAAGCSSGKDADTGQTPSWCSPIADAGPDQSTSLGANVTLDGLGSSMGDGCPTDNLVYSWTFDSVPADSEVTVASLSANGTVDAGEPKFVPDEAGSYVIALEVCEGADCSGPDVVVITVGADDAAPVADAGEDQAGQIDVRAELDGSGSYDPDGDPLTYSWALSEIPDCSALDSSHLFNPSSETASLIPDCEGIYLVSLVVSDGSQWSEPDYAVIEVVAGNQPPVADAGESSTNTPCDGQTLQLDGNGSHDPEGAELEYLWSVVSVPTASSATDDNFEDPTEAAPSFSWDVEGEYTFQLQVFDGEEWSAPDIVTVVISTGDSNRAPIANAGEDETVTLTAACVSTGGYVFECDDCASSTFTVDGSYSSDPDGDEIDYHWTEESGAVVIASPYTAVSQVTVPGGPAEYNTDAISTFNLNLSVADCANEDDDVLKVTVICTGE